MNKNIITDMEIVVMNLTGCNRQCANTVVNIILDMDRQANREFETEQDNKLKGSFENDSI
jgi:uncharacterized lipoprotein NlpE involved in copper resistance